MRGPFTLLFLVASSIHGQTHEPSHRIQAIRGIAEEAQRPPAASLYVQIVEGEGAINNIKQRTTQSTIVQVEDENHKPVAGATAVFLLPSDGPGGAFLDGGKSATVVTNSRGQAALPHMQTNQWEGPFRIRVHVSFHDREANAEIAQTNVAGAAGVPLPHAGISVKAIAIIAGVAVAGAAGAAAGLRGGSKSTPVPAPITPSTSISPAGSVVIGPPR